jgi:Domain of unknown function (DUF4336)
MAAAACEVKAGVGRATVARLRIARVVWYQAPVHASGARTTMEPYRPINTLKPVADEVWLVDGPVIEFRYLGVGLPFPTRMTIVRLADGTLWVHSPTELTAALRAEVVLLGPVRHLIAPNRIHYWWLGDWQRAFPDALAHGAPGVRARAAERGLAFDRDLGDQPPAEWAGQIDQLVVRGRYLSEVVFFHRASRSLILTDLIESFEADKVTSPWLRLVMRLAGCMHPDGSLPIDLRLTFLGHRRAFRAAVKTMLDWQPERVILAHGHWYPANACAELRRAFRWLGPLD